MEDSLVSDSPFMQSVERRRPGTSMRGYVTRTLPHSSAIVVSNRGPHEAQPGEAALRAEPGGGTALLTLAEVMDPGWVACARTDAERAREPAGSFGNGAAHQQTNQASLRDTHT